MKTNSRIEETGVEAEYPKKVVSIYAVFALPDDFKGDGLDAMKLLVKYHEKIGRDRQTRRRGKMPKAAYAAMCHLHEYLMDYLWSNIPKGDMIAAKADIHIFNSKTQEWKAVQKTK